MSTQPDPYDLFVIGGGINGTGIARDAVGRGYRVALAEMNDLASATSSSSTKLFHGGLRYLEFFEFSLVRKALIEREVLLRAMPHISWPMRFVIPYDKEMRFDSETPTSKLLSFVMPWMKGRRPAWLIRLGLFLYDNLGGREILPGTKRIDLTASPEGAKLKDHMRFAYEYSDCWVEDARLVLLNARDAALRGADVHPRTKVTSAEFSDGLWQVTMDDASGSRTVTAKMLVNAGGPWVENIIRNTMRLNSSEGVRLVRGSHIVTKRLFDHDKCYFFQGRDGRIIFAIPYETDFTLIGTTDAEHDGADNKPACTPEERDYLIAFINEYLTDPINADDIVWTYAGVRPLYDDGAKSATAATRDYVLSLDTSAGGPVLNVFGGKITTFRKLAEEALKKIDPVMGRETAKWTAKAALPGGDFDALKVEDEIASLQVKLPFLDAKIIRRLFRQYGIEARQIFKGAKSMDDLGQDFGFGITEREVTWAVENEWVRKAEDFLWRRSKLGLRVDAKTTKELDAFIEKQLSSTA